MTLTCRAHDASRERSDFLCRLSQAQHDHDAVRLVSRSGVTARALASDNRRWELVGEAVADLARLIVRQFAESAFADARPDAASLAARLSEAVDDLLDEPCWTVIDAAARCAAAEPGG